MYTIMIVDDEEWIRKGLVSKIRKSNIAIADIQQAADAEQALRMIGEKVPDIMICDIRMSEMDGLELIKIVHYKFPQIKTIILSGFGEFEYAAEALKVGVMDYLLKPIDQVSLDKALKKCVEAIQTEQAKLSKAKELERLVTVKETRQKVYHILQKDLKLNEIFSSYRSGDQFQAICLFVDPQAGNFDISLIDLALSQDPFWEIQKNIIFFEQKEFEIVLILSMPEIQNSPEIQEKMARLIQKIEMELQSTGKHRYTFGISRAHPDIEASIHEANSCMKHRIFMEENQIVRPEDILRFQATYKLPSEMIHRLQQCLALQNVKEVTNLFSSLYNDIISSPISYRSVQNVYNRLLMLATETSEVSIERFLHELPTEVYLFASLRQMFEKVRTLYISIINAAVPSRHSKLSVIQSIKTFIEENYFENITLEDIALQKGYNASYLSHLFKEVTGENFQDFLLTVRISRAKQLIGEGKHKLKDIANLVGFNDPHYFSQAFKKIEGVRPTEYRRYHQNQK